MVIYIIEFFFFNQINMKVYNKLNFRLNVSIIIQSLKCSFALVKEKIYIYFNVFKIVKFLKLIILHNLI